MTFRELYLHARQTLAAAGIDSPGEDSLALAERFLGLDRAGLALRGGETPPAHREADFLEAVARRAERRPLQYLLGRWDFMGLSLAVGEGVLCPREDTAVPVETLARRLRAAGKTAPVGLDLCAGTGAVALGLCSLLPETSVTCLELSDAAFPYLEQNLASYPRYHGKAVRADVLSPEAPAAFEPVDFLVSNPPYIRTEELSSLQPEVQKEPALALDGGADGLLFYRAILTHWLPLLKPGGVLAVEIGEDQGDDVSALFAAHGLREIEVCKDWAGLDRCVSGFK